MLAPLLKFLISQILKTPYFHEISMATEKILNGREITCIFLCENTMDEIEFVLL